MRIPYPFLVLLGLSVAVGAEANLVMRPSLVRPPLSAPPAAMRALDAPAPWALNAWWQGFEDDTLNALVLAAHQRTGATPGAVAVPTVAGATLALPVDMQVAAAYISARVDSIGLELIREAQAAARRESTLMSEDMLSDADRAVLGRRLVDAGSAERLLADRRQASLALLASHCGMRTSALDALVAPALSEQRLPQFAARVPARAPDAWVFERQDVVLAQALHAIAAQARPAEGRDGSDGSGAVDGVVTRAESEIAAALSELQAQQDRTSALEARAAGVRRALDDTLARQKDGSASELEVLEHYQQLMLSSQQFASASGMLALGWIKLVYRLQGAIDQAALEPTPPAALPWPGTPRRRLV
jgi:hypothetical protein